MLPSAIPWALIGWFAFCGNALGNEAQLILVAGDVRLQRTAAGAVQALVPVVGTTLRRGDTLVTGSTGRAQLRFSDASLVSLQPRSEFRIDDYQFDLAGQRGYFSLLRGALRSISGAVGQRDPDDYRMTTPTAVIGIRGTEFVLEETVCTPDCYPGRTAGLRVAVNAGRVVVFNAAGFIDLPPGGAAFVGGAALAPVPTTERPSVSTAPASPNPVSPAKPTRTAEASPEASPEGEPAKAAAAADDDESAPAAARGTAKPAAAAGGSARPVPSAGGTDGPAPVAGGTVEPAPVAGGAVEPVPVAGGVVEPVPLAGRAFEGSLADDADLRTSPRPLSDPSSPAGGVASGSGPSSPTLVAVVSPSQTDSTTIPVGDAPGANSERAANGVSVAIEEAVPARDPDPSGEPGADGGSGPGSTDGGGMGEGIPGEDVAGEVVPGQGIPGEGIPGENIPGGGGTGGVDAGEGTPPPLGPGFNNSERLAVQLLQSPWVDLGVGADGTVTLDANNQLESVGACPAIDCIARNTAQVVDAGYIGDVAWGRWVNGTARRSALQLGTEDREMGVNDGLHYLVGVPTAVMPTGGSATYSLAGATSPTFASGLVAPGTFTGQALVQFASGMTTQVGFRGDVVFGSGERYGMSSNGATTDAAGRLVEIGNSQLRMTGPTTFQGSVGVVSAGTADRLGCAGGACQAAINGGFYGSQAARMGIGYTVGQAAAGSRGDTISGVAVLNRE